MALLDWLRRGRRQAEAPLVWSVYRDGGDVVAEDRRGGRDELLGQPMADWRPARELARLVCARTELPLDELTEKMFSRVGQYSPAQQD